MPADAAGLAGEHQESGLEGIPGVLELLCYGQGKPLGLRASNASGQAFDGLLMPLT